jgi:hypothetical protein
MKIECLLAVVLLVAPAAARAADPNPPPPVAAARPASVESRAYIVLNKSIGELTAAFDKTQQCFDLEAALRKDSTAKKAQLTAEFKGAVPIAFNDLLWQKTARLEKQHKECAQQYDEMGKHFAALEQAFASVEPPSLNIKKQRALVAEQKEKFFQMQPTAKPYNKGPKTTKKAAN